MNTLLEIDLIRVLFSDIEFVMDFEYLRERQFYLVIIFMSKFNYHIFACPLYKYVTVSLLLRVFVSATHITEIV